MYKLLLPALLLIPATMHAASAPPPDVARMIAQYDELNDKCRGGSGDDPATMKACDERDALFDQIRAKNWCYGREGQAQYEKNWQKCSSK